MMNYWPAKKKTPDGRVTDAKKLSLNRKMGREKRKNKTEKRCTQYNRKSNRKISTWRRNKSRSDFRSETIKWNELMVVLATEIPGIVVHVMHNIIFNDFHWLFNGTLTHHILIENFDWLMNVWWKIKMQTMQLDDYLFRNQQ